MPKYIVQSQIRGLDEPRRGKGGNVEEHVLEAGDECDLDADEAAPFVAGGSLKLKGPSTAEAEAKAKVAANAEAKRRAQLTPEQRKAEDDAAAQGGQ